MNKSFLGNLLMGVSHKFSDKLDLAVSVKKNLAKENSPCFVEVGILNT